MASIGSRGGVASKALGRDNAGPMGTHGPYGYGDIFGDPSTLPGARGRGPGRGRMTNYLKPAVLQLLASQAAGVPLEQAVPSVVGPTGLGLFGMDIMGIPVKIGAGLAYGLGKALGKDWSGLINRPWGMLGTPMMELTPEAREHAASAQGQPGHGPGSFSSPTNRPEVADATQATSAPGAAKSVNAGVGGPSTTIAPKGRAARSPMRQAAGGLMDMDPTRLTYAGRKKTKAYPGLISGIGVT